MRDCLLLCFSYCSLKPWIFKYAELLSFPLYVDVKLCIFIHRFKGGTQTEGLEGQDAAENIWT